MVPTVGDMDTPHWNIDRHCIVNDTVQIGIQGCFLKT